MKVKYSKNKAVTIALSCFAISLSALIPFLVQRLIDGITSNYLDYKLVALILLAIPVRKVFDFFFNYFFNNLYNLASHDKRQEYVSMLLKSSSQNAYKIDQSAMNNRLMNEVYAFGSIDGLKDVMLSINIIMLVVSSLILIRISIYIFIAVCLLIPLIYLNTALIKKKMQKISEEHRLHYERVSFAIKEMCEGFEEIKVQHAEDNFDKRFRKENDDFYTLEKRLNFMDRLSRDSFDILFSVLPILSLVLGLILSHYGRCTISASIAFYMYLNFFIEPITNLTSFKMQMISATKRKELVEDKMNDLTVMTKGSKSVECKSINIGSIDHEYKNNHLNFGCDINISKSGIYFFSGKSGTGKSTVLKIVSKLLSSPDSVVTVDNQNIADVDEDSLFEHLTYLSTSPHIFNGTVKENITLFEASDIDQSELDLMFDESENINKDLFLDTKDSVPLSTGQMQRINILRLLSKDNKTNQKIILLDESLSGVDEVKEKKILNYLKAKFADSIIIVVSHRSATRDICDFCINFDNDKIVLEDIR